MCCSANSHYISRIFEHQMLRAAASAEKRNLVFPRVSDAGQRAFQTPVGTAWAAEQALKVSEVVRLVRGKPDSLKSARPKGPGGVLDAVVGGDVGWIGSVEITYDAYSHCGRHTPRIKLRWICVKSISLMS
jgi:hypothetical protein